MIASESLKIERLRTDRFEDRLPERAEEHRGAERTCGERRIDIAEFSVGDTSRDQAFEHCERSAEDFIEIESTELRECARFGDHEFRDRADRRLGDAAGDEAQKLGDERCDRSGVTYEHSFGCAEVVRDRKPDHALEERELVFEVEIDRRFAKPGTFGHIVQTCSGESFFDEELERCHEDLVGSLGRRTSLLRDNHTELTNQSVIKVLLFLDGNG
jgi:hypothetical protein